MWNPIDPADKSADWLCLSCGSLFAKPHEHGEDCSTCPACGDASITGSDYQITLDVKPEDVPIRVTTATPDNPKDRTLAVLAAAMVAAETHRMYKFDMPPDYDPGRRHDAREDALDQLVGIIDNLKATAPKQGKQGAQHD